MVYHGFDVLPFRILRLKMRFLSIPRMSVRANSSTGLPCLSTCRFLSCLTSGMLHSVYQGLSTWAES